MTYRDGWRIAFLLLLTATCLGFAAWNIYLALNPPDGPPCTLAPAPGPHGSVDRGWYLLAVLGGLLGGRAMGRGMRRTRRIRVDSRTPLVTLQGTELTSEVDLRDHIGIAQTSANPLLKVLAALIVQILIALFVTAALGGLLYETIGVSRGNDPWPLTFFIRCLNEGSPAHATSVSTLAVTTAVAFVIGSWFWPERSRPSAGGV